MGGNAFEDTRRLSEEDYARTCARVARALAEISARMMEEEGEEGRGRRRRRLEWRFPPEISDKAEVVRGEERRSGLPRSRLLQKKIKEIANLAMLY